MSQSFFERNSKLVLIGFNLVFILLIGFVVKLDIFQDSPGSEKYSLYDKIDHSLRCQGKRFINLRENTPNEIGFRVPPYDTSQQYFFRTDSDGFVEPSKIHENPDLNIFFIGGSTTECEMVKESERFPYLTGRILEKKTGKKINSYNAGKSGNNSIHSINNLINKIAPLNPNIVVHMETINDLSTLLYEASYWNRNASRSNLACFNKKRSSLRNFRNEWDNSPFRDKILDEQHRTKIKEEHRKILTLFIATTKALGATPVLMTQANKIVGNPHFEARKTSAEFNETYRKLYAEFQNITRRVAKENKVILIDLAKEIPAQDEYLYDSVHFSNEGSILAAKIISKKLQNHVSN